ELLLSRVQGTGVRTTRNLFGLNARVRDRFSLPDSPRLRLWVSRINNKRHLTPMLIDDEGEFHALSLGSVLLWEKREASQRYLKTLSDFLGRRWPAPKAPPTRTERAPRRSPPRVSAAAPSRSAGASMAPASSHIASASAPTKSRIQHRNDLYAPIEE